MPLLVAVLGSHLSCSSAGLTTFHTAWFLIKTALLAANEYLPGRHRNKSYTREIDIRAIHLKLSFTYVALLSWFMARSAPNHQGAVEKMWSFLSVALQWKCPGVQGQGYYRNTKCNKCGWNTWPNRCCCQKSRVLGEFNGDLHACRFVVRRSLE